MHKNNRVYIIAEAGVNHNGDLDIAKKLIGEAKAAGADAIKFQTFKAEKLVTSKAEMADYQKVNTGSSASQFEMLKKLELSYEDHIELMKYSEAAGIEFLSTPFDMESVDLLEGLGVKIYKISSGEIVNKPLIRYIASKNKPIILSTGMSELEEIQEAIDWIKEVSGAQLYLLHCTTDYPVKLEEVNLSAMHTMRQAFGLSVGYSDHTLGIEVSIAAAALGACIIEKHFTLDKSMEGPDHKASLDTSELKELVRCIRNIETAIGDGVKSITPAEAKIKNKVRKSIVAKRNIQRGKLITIEDIDIKRPEGGIQPKYFEQVLGKTALIDVAEDAFIRWEDIK